MQHTDNAHFSFVSANASLVCYWFLHDELSVLASGSEVGRIKKQKHKDTNKQMKGELKIDDI